MTTGIDCSKDFFDLVVISEEKTLHSGKYSNTKKRFEKILSYVQDSHVVMEDTEPYYLQLALFLAENKV